VDAATPGQAGIGAVECCDRFDEVPGDREDPCVAEIGELARRYIWRDVRVGVEQW
jgi:hypothetical protein